MPRVATGRRFPQFVDTDVPIVLWGINSTLVKYGLVDSMERPGHNATGVVEVNDFTESLPLLKRLAPNVKTFAILSDDAETGRSHIKGMEEAARKSDTPLQIVDTVVVNKFEEWKAKALELSQRVDALFLPSMNTLEDAQGRDISREEALRWYVTNIKIPETVHSKAYVQQGLLCTADFARYNQGFDAAKMAHDILANGMKPAEYPPRSGPARTAHR